MTKFMFAYHGGGGAPETPEEGAAEMAKWQSWLQGMGQKCHEEGAPVGLSKTVTKSSVEDNGGANPLSGYSIVDAASIEEACEMAKGCPIVVDGSGSVEVAPIMEM
ncbi:MAG: hypothetical protein AAF231_03135 [Pseudomonadota bacterium]